MRHSRRNNLHNFSIYLQTWQRISAMALTDRHDDFAALTSADRTKINAALRNRRTRKHYARALLDRAASAEQLTARSSSFDFRALFALDSRVKAPNFTRENAGDMARRATIARLAREERERIAAREAIDALARMPVTEDARRAVTLRQIDLIDASINDALERKLHDRAIELVAAKERLWKLVQPTAGSLRPGRARRESAPMLAEPQPIAPAVQVSPVPIVQPATPQEPLK